jgi:hypothetical protein
MHEYKQDIEVIDKALKELKLEKDNLLLQEVEIKFGQIVKIKLPSGDYFFMPTEYIADIVNRHYIKQVSEREELKDIFNARQKEIDEYIKLEG